MYFEMSTPGHLFVCLLCNCKDVGIHIPHVLSAVGINDGSVIDGQSLIRIDGNQDNS